MPITIQQRVIELKAQYGSVRATARVLGIDHVYLHRLAHGTKTRPGKVILRKLGLRQIVSYEPLRLPPHAIPSRLC